MEAGSSVFVAGHRGMVGSALMRRLAREPLELVTRGREELDLTQGSEVSAFFELQRPEYVFLAAAKVGGG